MKNVESRMKQLAKRMTHMIWTFMATILKSYGVIRAIMTGHLKFDGKPSFFIIKTTRAPIFLQGL